VTLPQFDIAAATYPATISLIVSPLVGLAASAVVVDVPVVYGFSNYQLATAVRQANTVSLTGFGGAPATAAKFWLESFILSYSLDGGETFPPTASAVATLEVDSLNVAAVVTPGAPVCAVDCKHYSLLSGVVPFSFAATANVGIYATFLFSAQ